jgi:tryptophan-rich sensory protein
MSNLLKLVLAVVAPLAVGALSGFATAQGVRDWYPELTKPWFNPPAWVFGPVWTVLYLLMGVAAYLVWRKGIEQPGVKLALLLFLAQLALNAAWSFLFFGMRKPGLAFAEILLLWLLIAATLVAFYARSRVAGLLLVPYLGWVGFAAFLNHALWRLNR